MLNIRVLSAVVLAMALTVEVTRAADCTPWYVVSPGVCRRDCVEWDGWRTRAYSEYTICGTFTGCPAPSGAPVAIMGGCTPWYPDNTVLGLCRRECWDGWRVRTEYKVCGTLQAGEIANSAHSPSPCRGAVVTYAPVSHPCRMKWRRCR